MGRRGSGAGGICRIWDAATPPAPIPDLIGNPERYSAANLDSPKQPISNWDSLRAYRQIALGAGFRVESRQSPISREKP